MPDHDKGQGVRHRPDDGGQASAPRRKPGHSARDRTVHDDHLPGPADQPQNRQPTDRRRPGEGDERVN